MAAYPTFAYALVFALAPGLAVALWALSPRRGLVARLGVALAISPAVGGLALAPFLLHGSAGLKEAALGLLVIAAVAAAAGLARRVSSAGEAETSTGSSRTIAWVAVLAVAATASFPTFVEWWRLYSDAWTHSGIARAVQLQGVPPMDPGFAGVRLQYAYIYHVFVAAAQALTGVDVYVFMALLGAMALGGLVLSAGSALPREDRSTIGWTLALLLLGLNATFPLFLPVQLGRAFTGTVRGWAEVRRLFAILPLDNDRSAVFLHSLGGGDYFLDKFMVATPFALSLACYTAWWAVFRRWLARGERADLVVGSMLTLTAGLMHPVVGIDLGAVAACVFAASLLGRPGGETGGRARRWGVAVLVGLVPVVLYTATILGGKGGTHHEPPVDLAPLKILGYVSCLGLGLAFGARPFARAWRGRDEERGWAVALAASVGIALFARLPGPSPFFTVDKFVYLVWIPLALTAGPALARFMRTRSRVAQVGLALAMFLPVNGLMFASRIVDRHNGLAQPWDRPVYAWLRVHAPADAVLLTPAGDWETAQFARRDQYFSLGHASAQLGYDRAEIAARAGLVERVFSSGHLAEADRARLAALHRPVYLVWTDFREPLWKTTPGEMARDGLEFGPRPTFDASVPLLFAGTGQEVRGVRLPETDGSASLGTGKLTAPDSSASRP